MDGGTDAHERDEGQGNAGPVKPDPAQEEVTVAELSEGMAGRWEVRTRNSRHLWDLDALTYTRLPGDDSTPFEHDAHPMPITRVER